MPVRDHALDQFLPWLIIPYVELSQYDNSNANLVYTVGPHFLSFEIHESTFLLDPGLGCIAQLLHLSTVALLTKGKSRVTAALGSLEVYKIGAQEAMQVVNQEKSGTAESEEENQLWYLHLLLSETLLSTQIEAALIPFFLRNSFICPVHGVMQPWHETNAPEVSRFPISIAEKLVRISSRLQWSFPKQFQSQASKFWAITFGKAGHYLLAEYPVCRTDQFKGPGLFHKNRGHGFPEIDSGP
ncbi:hypothetical protein BDZ91DRAFT_763181 [Kalaharituber pfeilii]|nr:hypothetical protein BDZ91DRAFT_763181 [Kalaharituber pfeilii]